MKSAGLTLKQARLAQGMSVEDIARITRISRSVIEAIECDDKEKLPADVYVRGFTRNIAVVLGINPAEILQSHQAKETTPPLKADIEKADEQRFSMVFGHGASHHTSLGGVHLAMAVAAITLCLAGWWLVGDQKSEQKTALEIQRSVPAIQEHVDAVTPFTAQGMRADARR